MTRFEAAVLIMAGVNILTLVLIGCLNARLAYLEREVKNLWRGI